MAPLRIVARSAVLAVGLAMLPGSSPVTAATSSVQPAVGTAVRFDVTPPLQDMPIVSPGISNPDPGERDGAAGVADAAAAQPAVAAASGAAAEPAVAAAATTSMPGPVRTFEGIANGDNPVMVSPPDPVGDIGMDHYVEMVNETFAVYARDGTRLFGPAAWAPSGRAFSPTARTTRGTRSSSTTRSPTGGC
jgi:hypothetical protein